MQHQTARTVPRLGRHVRRLFLGYNDVPAAEAARVCTGVLQDLEAFPRLTTLGLGRCEDGYPSALDDTVAFAIFTAKADLLQNLQSLSWTHSGRGFLSLLLRLSALRSLSLSSDTTPTWQLHFALVPLPFHFTSLVIDSDLFLPSSHLLPLISTSLPTLTDLHLPFNLLRAVVDLGEDSAPVLPKLRTLDLVCNSFGDTTEDITWALAQLASLRRLALLPLPYNDFRPATELLLALRPRLEALHLIHIEVESRCLNDYIERNSNGASLTISISSSSWV